MILKIFVALGFLSIVSFLAYHAWKSTVQWRGVKQAKGFYSGMLFLLAGIYLVKLSLNSGATQLQCDPQRCILERQNIYNVVVEQQIIPSHQIQDARIRERSGSRGGINYSWVLATGLNEITVVSFESKGDAWLQAASFQGFLENKKLGFVYRQDHRWQNMMIAVAGLLMAALGAGVLGKVIFSKEHF